MLKPNEFARFLIERANKKDGYIMCAIGQDPKKLSDWYYTGQYSGKQLERALYWKQNAERVWDCQGLADGYVTEMTGTYVNVRARNNYADWCSIKGTGKIPVQYRMPGAAVFIHDGNYVTHVGYLVEPVDKNNTSGDWWVVEARGVMYGVVKTKLLSRSWNRWGLMTKYFDYSEKLRAVDDQDYYSDHKRTLRMGYSGEDVADLQRDLISLGYSCGKYGADGEFGLSTRSAVIAFQHDNGLEEDGIVGSNTFATIDNLLKDDDEPDIQTDPISKIEVLPGTWYVRTAPSANSSKLGVVKGGTQLPAGSSTNEYWVNVICNGESAWIGKKAVMI